MEASSIPLSLVCLPPRRVSANPNHRPPRFSRSKRGVGHARAPPRIHAIDGAADLGPPVELTWQVAVGALAGITPFVVAGIEFGKRIVVHLDLSSNSMAGRTEKMRSLRRLWTCSEK
ncbi:uncharacterized protein LOC103698011 isoform X3 [Phoenix dactylifera]|uniref:Uncharacterized protein LOC103698011 isoform X3 n=1 Tax=Phoenix dactylifera TaxID=42345 RepID=A0A8B8ZPI0_PHODC|nr:uncharacterized protein LOC103698011 isoform X3 [Phoenix dactylifera]